MSVMMEHGLERKFCQLEANVELVGEAGIEGYASRFGEVDQGGDLVSAGAYGASLARLTECGRAVKMLWQHDPTQPIGIWDEVRKDARGLYVKGRLLTEVARAREAATLLAAGAIDGLSIGYRTVRAHKNEDGRRVLAEIDLWEVSLVTFPMLPTARVGAKAETPPAADASLWHELAEVVTDARRRLACTD